MVKVMSEAQGFSKVMFCVTPLPPTRTLPKLMFVGLTVSVHTGVTPVPDKETVFGELVALLVTTTLLPAGATPAAVGENRTVKVLLMPGANVGGGAVTTMNSALAVAVIPVTVVFPVLVMVTC